MKSKTTASFGPDNIYTRHSEGDFIRLKDGRILFVYSRFTGGAHDDSPSDLAFCISGDEGETWSIVPTAVYTGADESKLEVMNDNSLILSVRRGGWNSMANRGYNRSTGDASGDGIGSWESHGIWGNEMNANGCNADILYYNRITENATRPDVILHTLTKTFSTYRRDLRLSPARDCEFHSALRERKRNLVLAVGRQNAYGQGRFRCTRHARVHFGRLFAEVA